MTATFPDDFKTVRIFQMTANFLDYFKTVWIFQMTANFPNYFKTVRIFPVDCQFSGNFQNCPDFSRWLPISRIISRLSQFFFSWLPIFLIISKLSGFFQITANFPNYFKTVWIFPGDCQFSRLFQNCSDFYRWLPILRMISKLPGFSRWMPIFRIISKLSGFFQITANFPNYFKTVWIFPGDCHFSGLFQNCPDFSR